ncbi:F-box family protein [Arabidopsis lyrata subsp. lyrata]|uniref:F-box family protein n=1 Tax=Arabidopsis lyrata subsp. lyrata TaxID=81972 RepID=D7M1H1_ARALL|nr:F-box family protein [Arabidopsis lyrata subsp. lyrata]
MESRIERSICVEPLAGFSNAREDLISKLPEVLISQILSYLPTKDIVRTSVLSKRWKSIWLLIPGLHLDSCEFPDYNTFVDFMNDFLFSSREPKSCLNKLKLSIQKDETDPSCVTLWTDFVARGKLTHLDVEFGGRLLMRVYWELMPLSLYTCKTLLHLRLYRVLLRKFDPRVDSLPRLKTLCLEENVYPNEASLESLISSCPVLEDLTIVRADDNVRNNSGLVVDAPRLKYLTFNNEKSKSKTISNLGSLVKVNILGPFNISSVVGCSKEQMAHNFLAGISTVRYLIVSEDMMELIYSYLKVDSLPQFCNLSCLKASVWLSSFDFLDILPKLLESCPNLKFIVLDTTCIVNRTKAMVERRVSPVPKCLLSSLEFVEIKNRISVDDGALEVARYFVENSMNLKKLVLGLASSFLRLRLANRAVLKDLLALPRRSSMCQIEVFNALNGRALCYRKNKKTGRVGRIF